MSNEAKNGGDSKSNTAVQLGFSVPFDDDEHRSLISHKSPQWQEWDGGQIGGRPSWLQPKDIPRSGMTCEGCSEPLVFVCQLYAPADEVTPEAFHRSLYLFACASKECAKTCEGTVKVLRTQLPEENPYYPSQPEEEVNWTKHAPTAWDVNLCAVCGQRGKGFCSLQQKHFCSKQHQIECKKCNPQSTDNNKAFFPSVYTESELVVEEEPSTNESKKSLESKGIFTNDGNDEDADLEQEDLNAITGAITSEASKDPTTNEFYARTKVVPNIQDQCLRYMRWPSEESATLASMPLWIRSDHQPPKDIPPCSYCGEDRKFECQIMPQMIHYLMKDHAKQSLEKGHEKNEQAKEAIAQASSILEQAPAEQVPPELAESNEKAVEAMRSKLMDDNDGLNWGVISVYTCTASCGGGLTVEEGQELGAYREEYAWKQPSLD
ncbi:unnamed protein product [Cylindrotheca closterium]|uniref:Programmed cell death protein 2 C-terminal domain-containing protein n=1 Tax=Cylindrotheca closterium TaxID=2856 RepID=A0AAD2CDX3_9STRA|nr:unnamed protein product [Cylindrotheca closterium]